jgi:hypothetical protein
MRQLDPAAPDWRAQVGVAADLVGVLEHLGALPRLDGVSAAAPAAEDPERAGLLTKIKRPLAMAESTAFAEEADSFTAKASELMLRHRIDRAVVEASSSIPEVHAIVARRCWMEPPYVDQKSFLCHVVAEASNCRAVWHDYGFSAIVGQPEDVDLTELLFASLLVQATRQMTVVGTSAEAIEAVAAGRARELCAGWEASGGGPPAGVTEETLHRTIAGLLLRDRRTPSFRRSFLVAYAKRIEQRLAALRREATAAAEAELGASFLPVLARQEQEVDEAVDRLYGRLSRSRVRTTSAAGWVAGTAAADLADLGVRDALRTG